MGTEAVSYLRVSGRGQITKDGFPRQRRAITGYARAHGIEILEEFLDEGVSGTKVRENRPGLSALFERILGNGIQIVLIEQASRLGRDSVVSELMLREFREAGVRVIATDSGVELTEGSPENATAKLIRQVLAAVAEFEKDALVMKLRVARRRKRARGERCEGAKPFGELPGEPEVLERILQLRRKPKGLPRRGWKRIAAVLNVEGHRTRRGGPWKPESVRKIVQRIRPRLAVPEPH